MRLLALPEHIQSLVQEGSLSAGHARALLAVADREKQIALANLVVEKGLSVREVERLSRDVSPKTIRAQRRPSPILDRFVGDLQRSLATKVRVRERSDGKGRIEIEFYSSEDLERILTLLGRSA
jgi:ParB family chromosome partitioning protein